MRIIGGTLRGKRIDVPASFKSRPTTDFAREALFNILSNEYDFDGIKVLDLFAGTGAVSYEFCSRGAGHVWSVEMSSLHHAFIKKNAEALRITNLSAVRHNVFDFLEICTEKFDIIFADPPYDLAGLDTIPDNVLNRDILHEGCYFILEHGGEYDFGRHPFFVKEKKYGNVHFSFFEKKSE